MDVSALMAETEADEMQHERLVGMEGMKVLAVQHSRDPDSAGPANTYILLFDTTVTWGVPGDPPYAAVHLTRNQAERTFRLDSEYHPLPALARNWLGQRGADPLAVAPDASMQFYTADQATVNLEQQLARSGDRFSIIDNYTYDDVFGHGADRRFFWKTWVIADDRTPGPGEQPVRVFFEDFDVPADAYTLREGGFPTIEAAREWTETVGDQHPTPLPTVLRAAGVRSTAARAGRPSTVPPATPGPVRPPTTGNGSTPPSPTR